MKFTKKIVLSSVLALGLLSQATIGSAVDVPTGQLNVTLTGSDPDGALTLDSVADLSGQINITNNANTTAPLTKTGNIKISDTRDVATRWHLSVEVKQPTERGTDVLLGASGISFNINVADNGNENLTPANPTSVLESSTEVLSGQYSAVIPANTITSELTLGAAFSSKTKGVYQNTIIYTLTEEVPATDPYAPITDENPEVGETIQFADTNWRILKVDDGKALIIKENALTKKEATGQEVAGYYSPLFRDSNRYFSDDGTNGYDAGGGNTAYLKGAIDYYYGTISAEAKNYVLPVNLNNPNLETFKSKNNLDWSYNSGSVWNDFYKDTDFATTLDGGGSKQAFALSYGDIHTLSDVSADSNYTDLLNFSSSNVNYFWLRSASNYFYRAGYVVDGGFNGVGNVNTTRPVRPALWISLNK